jgi:hypothetical protein
MTLIGDRCASCFTSLKTCIFLREVIQKIIINNYLHGAEAFSEINTQPFMEPEVSLSSSKEPTIHHYPEPDESSPHLPILFS